MGVTGRVSTDTSRKQVASHEFHCFAAFVRCDELITLKCCDIKFHEHRMVVLFESSKTDQLREGAEVVVARTGTKTFPVAVLEQYVRIVDIDLLSNARLFRAIVKSKNGESLRKGGGISYSLVREFLLEKLRSLGCDPSLFWSAQL